MIGACEDATRTSKAGAAEDPAWKSPVGTGRHCGLGEPGSAVWLGRDDAGTCEAGRAGVELSTAEPAGTTWPNVDAVEDSTGIADAVSGKGAEEAIVAGNVGA